MLRMFGPNIVACHAKGYKCTDISASGSGYSSYVDMYNATSNTLSTHPEGLGEARCCLAAASLLSGLVFFAGGQHSEGSSSFVDIYNITSNSWANYPTGLKQARIFLTAASLPSGLVLFAGGMTGSIPSHHRLTPASDIFSLMFYADDA